MAVAPRECKLSECPEPIGFPIPMAEMHDTTEEYLETILELEEEGVLPIRARLVERLGVSAPSVSETVSRLVEAGYTELMADRSLRLTEKGRALATTVVRRHRLAERLLVDVIGLEWEKVHKEAARWEHAISTDVEEKLILLLGDPATCPHGNPIPGTSRAPDSTPTKPLSLVTKGEIRVIRIGERIEVDDDALHLLATADLIPGKTAEVLETSEDGVSLRTATGDYVVPNRIADLMFVASL